MIIEREHARAVADYLRRNPRNAHLPPLQLSKRIEEQLYHPTYNLQNNYLVTIFPDLLEKAARSCR
jgi:hypothetical protein